MCTVRANFDVYLRSASPLKRGMGFCSFLILAPIAWPIAKLLDRVLGKSEDTTYKKAELRTFLQFHRNSEEPLRDDEITILNGVLSLNDKRVDKIMTPIEVCKRMATGCAG